MKTKWTIDDDVATLECLPETVTDKSIMEGLGNVSTAVVAKKNGTLSFLISLPKEPIARQRGTDEVRDL